MPVTGPLRSGELDQRLILIVPVYTSPPDEIASWTTLATVWANVDVSQGDEKASQGDREVSLQTATVKIRYRDDVSTPMKVTLDGVDYDIRKVAPSGRRNREFLMLTIRAVR